MVVMILERAPASLRGELTRWLIEPKAGVFVGKVSAMVRDKLWEKVCQKSNGGGCMMFFSAANEQGFDIRFWGATRRVITDWDGLKLITKPRAANDVWKAPSDGDGDEEDGAVAGAEVGAEAGAEAAAPRDGTPEGESMTKTRDPPDTPATET